VTKGEKTFHTWSEVSVLGGAKRIVLRSISRIGALLRRKSPQQRPNFQTIRSLKRAVSSLRKGGLTAETRKVIDCRRFPADKPCSIVISGTEEDVLDLEVLDAASVHRHANSTELRQQLRAVLEDEGAGGSAAA
jgi:hypothetical protein